MAHYKSSLIAYAFVHFVIDFSCAFLMINSIAKGSFEIPYLFLLYNFCAFALQMPLGVIADRLKNPVIFAILGCLLLVPACFLSSVLLVCVILAGLGNAFFHIGGGTRILRHSSGKCSPLGIFIAPGALGIFLGSSSIMNSQFFILIPLILLASAALLYTADGRPSRWKVQPDLADDATQSGVLTGNSALNSLLLPSEFYSPGKIILPLGCFFLVVLLRSYTGTIMTFPWKTTTTAGILLVTAVIFGKVLGGILADRFGVIKTTILSLSLSSVLFLFSSLSPAGLTAVFLFNMTMPITLWAAADIMKKHEGFSFGMLTFALFIGYSLVTVQRSGKLFLPLLYMMLALVSMLLLTLGLFRRRSHGA